MAKRVESPSSINTFKQCPRKYYYHYVEKKPTFPSIHTVRGNIAHSTLEEFYDIDFAQLNNQNYAARCKVTLQKLLLRFWKEYATQLESLGLTKDQERFYFEETVFMLMNWANHFVRQVKAYLAEGTDLQNAFEQLTPIREQEYRCEKNSVRGFIDAIHHVQDKVHIIDYKTNSRFEIKDSIKLQLAIYCLLYFEKHGQLPDKVGIFFLRDKLKMMTVDQALHNLAQSEIELIHAHTSTTEHIADYPRKITPLCKWKTGQCDFYGICKPHGK